MVVIQLQGGLGNQMFQYAIASIIAEREKTSLLVDSTVLENPKKIKNVQTVRNFELGVFNNKYKFADIKKIEKYFNPSKMTSFKKRFNFPFPKIFKEPGYNFHEYLLYLKSPVYLKGYFQSYKYFLSNEEYVRDLFLFSPKQLGDKNLELLEIINKKDTVSVHIRRGDYITNREIQNIHGNCDMHYYLKAIDIIAGKVKNPTLIFFSDELDWVREKFSKVEYNSVFVDYNFGEDSWKDMILMSKCSHNIIANSSFSWWGAWLNKNPEKIVIAPRNWFKDIEMNEKTMDLIPPKWLRI
ncbi:alpha-1,2-fucosyltransferase [Antarcticibacterium arcticum]|uniref:Alpha-1,2-fucosyltransferase n=1 Tax=Antarcticibacterium arcticum TaxID=2585771 RepID=A0A5B8YJ64_9FLAO|nr:alpha-1,2-fucosyltransferase [Antarcticibacterium arcticum]QED37765.1 alpha-1,2-fucosyltransferase [Antarcticibacterium arcticum]